MAKENFTEYTEVDPNSRITVTADRVTRTGLTKNEDAYVYNDKEVDHFDGDFEHLIDVYLNASDDGGFTLYWALTNIVDDFRALYAVEDEIAVGFYRTGAVYYLQIYESDGVGDAGYSDSYICSLDTTYYLKIKRDESVGTYGTIYVYIYSDAARNNLLSTLSIALHSAKTDFRYIFACQSDNRGQAPAQSGYSENLDLQEEAIFYKTLSVTAVSVPSLSTIVSHFRTLSAIGTGVASLTKTFFKTLTVTATGIVSLTGIKIFCQTLAVKAIAIVRLKVPTHYWDKFKKQGDAYDDKYPKQGDAYDDKYPKQGDAYDDKYF